MALKCEVEELGTSLLGNQVLAYGGSSGGLVWFYGTWIKSRAVLPLDQLAATAPLHFALAEADSGDQQMFVTVSQVHKLDCNHNLVRFSDFRYRFGSAVEKTCCSSIRPAFIPQRPRNSSQPSNFQFQGIWCSSLCRHQVCVSTQLYVWIKHLYT